MPICVEVFLFLSSTFMKGSSDVSSGVARFFKALSLTLRAGLHILLAVCVDFSATATAATRVAVEVLNHIQGFSLSAAVDFSAAAAATTRVAVEVLNRIQGFSLSATAWS